VILAIFVVGLPMPFEEFDPKKFTGREDEQRFFEKLLLFHDDYRILAIEDTYGMGKTQLLKKFQYICRCRKPSIPVSLINLSKCFFPSDLIKEIVRDLKYLEFPKFKYLEIARTGRNFGVVSALADLRWANLQHAEQTEIAGMMAKVLGPVQNLTMTTSTIGWTDDQEITAREKSIEAFFEDLSDHCVRSPVVLMMDAYDKCCDELKGWIEDDFLERQFFNSDNRPNHLMLVIAGEKLPNFHWRWSEDVCEKTVLSIQPLSKLTKEDIGNCLSAYGLTNDNQLYIEVLCSMIEIGLPLSLVIQVIEGIVSLYKKR
jgi:hypothetical protein